MADSVDIQLMREANEALKWLYLLVTNPVRGGRGLTLSKTEIFQKSNAAITKLEERLLQE